MKPGSIGVFTTDTRTQPRLYRLTDHPTRMGVAYFSPLDDPGALVAAPLSDFWVLLDYLP